MAVTSLPFSLFAGAPQVQALQGINYTPTNALGIATLALLPFTNGTLTIYPPTGSGLPTVTTTLSFLEDGSTVITFNKPPIINNLVSASIAEGDTYTTNGTFTDPDSSSWTATVDYGDGSGVQPLTLTGTSFSLSHMYKDNGTYTVTVAVTDNQGKTGTTTATITVNNAAPIVGTIIVATSPVIVNSPITASATFADFGVLDTHIAVWNWGDGTTSTGTVTETSGTGSVSDSHTYTTTGVYTIIFTVTDKDGATGTSQYQYVVVYDPTGGFLTGSGKYSSQAGWDTQNIQASGEVKVGVQAHYLNSVLVGNMKMNFKVDNLDFNSTSYQWLVVNGAKATLKGNGTVNGSGNYTFLFSGIDGSQTGGQSFVRFQITNSSNTVIYDTQPGAADTSDPITPLTNGVIKLH